MRTSCRFWTRGGRAIAALATGLIQGCVDECVRYASRREAFGRPIGAHQAEQAVTAACEACQVFGGYGFTTKFPVSRFYQGAKILEIGEGTSEVQRMVIAREMCLPR